MISDYINKLTGEVLRLCAPHYKAISIDCSDDSIKSSIGFPFDHLGHIFGEPILTKSVEKHNFPPIWDIIRSLQLHGGCGDGHSCQLKYKHNLTSGVYFNNIKWVPTKIFIDGSWWIKKKNTYVQYKNESFTWEDYIIREVLL